MVVVTKLNNKNRKVKGQGQKDFMVTISKNNLTVARLHTQLNWFQRTTVILTTEHSNNIYTCI